jgi:hypothetical protein
MDWRRGSSTGWDRGGSVRRRVSHLTFSHFVRLILAAAFAIHVFCGFLFESGFNSLHHLIISRHSLGLASFVSPFRPPILSLHRSIAHFVASFLHSAASPSVSRPHLTCSPVHFDISSPHLGISPRYSVFRKCDSTFPGFNRTFLRMNSISHKHSSTSHLFLFLADAFARLLKFRASPIQYSNCFLDFSPFSST